MPPNVHFLGLKPQIDLPAYVQRFDVGLIPFKVTDTTHAVSPLKAYEYLASGVPVAAPPLRSLEGLRRHPCAGGVTPGRAPPRPAPGSLTRTAPARAG
jgi:glycosyltransferase involved in cell wall biosynthesis